MSPTSRFGGASFTLSPSWIGRRERFWRGVCRTRWKPTSASRRLRKPSPDTQRRKSSTRIRGRSSPASHSRRRSGDAEVRISMDGRGRWMDNVFIERLWRSLKYECVFLNAFETGGAARDGSGRAALGGIGRWLDYYNRRRPHSALGDRTPDEAYGIEIDLENLAA